MRRRTRFVSACGACASSNEAGLSLLECRCACVERNAHVGVTRGNEEEEEEGGGGGGGRCVCENCALRIALQRRVAEGNDRAFEEMRKRRGDVPEREGLESSYNEDDDVHLAGPHPLDAVLTWYFNSRETRELNAYSWLESGTARKRSGGGGGWLTKKTDARDESCPEDMYISRKMTNAEVYECATAVGHKLRIEIGLELGDKVIICLEPGLEFIVAFLGTMLAGLVPVPIYPAMPSAMLDTQEECHIARVARDCGASYALTSVTYHAAARLASLRNRTWDGGCVHWLPIAVPRLLSTFCSVIAPVMRAASMDADPSRRRRAMGTAAIGVLHARYRPEDVAFLQYTSGSTFRPKAVIVTHGALMHNLAQLLVLMAPVSHRSVEVSWLPPYHDMGLIGAVLVRLAIRGGHCVLFDPLLFVRRPLAWPAAMSRFGATHTGGPDFAYGLIARRERERRRRRRRREGETSQNDQEGYEYDLSRLHFALVGGERVRMSTMRAFIDTFSRCGLDDNALFPSYGLAECCVYVSHRRGVSARSIDVSHAAKAKNGDDATYQQFVAVGQPVSGFGVEILVVNVDDGPDKFTPALDGEIGEIWIHSRSCARGYWRSHGVPNSCPAESDKKKTMMMAKGNEDDEHENDTFKARLSSDGEKGGGHAREDGKIRTAEPHVYLRTGDLGTIVGQGASRSLYIVGRMKDVIVLHGRNIHPDDAEEAAASPATTDDAIRIDSDNNVVFRRHDPMSTCLHTEGSGGGRLWYAARRLMNVATQTLGHSCAYRVRRIAAVAVQRQIGDGEFEEGLAILVETDISSNVQRYTGDVQSNDAFTAHANVIRANVQARLGIGASVIVFVSRDSLPRTTSGKVRRRSAAQMLETLISAAAANDSSTRTSADGKYSTSHQATQGSLSHIVLASFPALDAMRSCKAACDTNTKSRFDALLACPAEMSTLHRQRVASRCLLNLIAELQYLPLPFVDAHHVGDHGHVKGSDAKIRDIGLDSSQMVAMQAALDACVPGVNGIDALFENETHGKTVWDMAKDIIAHVNPQHDRNVEAENGSSCIPPVVVPETPEPAAPASRKHSPTNISSHTVPSLPITAQSVAICVLVAVACAWLKSSWRGMAKERRIDWLQQSPITFYDRYGDGSVFGMYRYSYPVYAYFAWLVSVVLQPLPIAASAWLRRIAFSGRFMDTTHPRFHEFIDSMHIFAMIGTVLACARVVEYGCATYVTKDNITRQVRAIIGAAVGVSAAYYLSGPTVLVVELVVVALVFVIFRSIRRRKSSRRLWLGRWLAWTLHIGLLFAHDRLIGDTVTNADLRWRLIGEGAMPVRFSIAYTFRHFVLRSLSFALESLDDIDCRDSRDSTVTLFVQLLDYVFYAPLALAGPFMEFKRFTRLRNTSDTSTSFSAASASAAAATATDDVDVDDGDDDDDVTKRQDSVVRKIARTALEWATSPFVVRLASLTLVVAAIDGALHSFYSPNLYLRMSFSGSPVPVVDKLAILVCWTIVTYYQTCVVLQFFGVCASLDLLGPRHVFAPGNRLLDIADDGPLNFIAASTSLRQYWSQFHISWHTFFLRRIFVPICVRGDFSQLAATTATMGFSAALHGASSPHWLFFAVFNIVGITVEKALDARWRRYRNRERWLVVLNQLAIIALVLGMSGMLPLVFDSTSATLSGIAFILPLLYLTQLAVGST